MVMLKIKYYRPFSHLDIVRYLDGLAILLIVNLLLAITLLFEVIW